MKHVALVLFIFFTNALMPAKVLAGQNIIVLQDDPVKRLSIQNAWYLEDSSHLLSVHQIAQGCCEDQFKVQNARVLSFKYSKSTFWIRVIVQNNSRFKRQLVLEIPSSNIEDISMFRSLADTVMHFGTSGMQHPYNPDHVFNGDYYYNLGLQGGEKAVLYIKVQNDLSSLRVPMFLWDQPEFTGKQHLEALGWGVFFGIMLLIMFFNLTIYFYVRDPINLYYVAYIGALFLYQVNSKGLLFEFFYPKHPDWTWSMVLITTVFAIVGHLRFTQIFLSLKELSFRTYQILNGVILFMFSFFIIWLLRPFIAQLGLTQFFIQLFNFVPVTCFLLVFYAIAKGIRRKDQPSIIYTLAFTPLILTSLVISLRNNNLAPYYGIMDYRIPICFSFEMVVFSFALAYRFKLLKDEKERLLIEKTELQVARFKAVIEATENERKRIAQDLHDGLGQLLSTAKLNVSSMEDSVNEDDRRQFENSMALIDEACVEVRSISHNMMPSTLIRMGLLPALKELVNKVNIPGQMEVELITSGFTERLDESTEIAIYRVIQETLNNAIKYSAAPLVKVILQKDTASLMVEITDNGRGFDTATIGQSDGIGWRNIYSRVAILNGQIQVKSSSGKGTTITIHIDT